MQQVLSNVSLVSAVGTDSKLIAYGNNRADYTFTPGGMVPGVTILQPDFPELTAAWPFFWYENEYVVTHRPLSSWLQMPLTPWPNRMGNLR